MDEESTALITSATICKHRFIAREGSRFDTTMGGSVLPGWVFPAATQAEQHSIPLGGACSLSSSRCCYVVRPRRAQGALGPRHLEEEGKAGVEREGIYRS